MTVDGLSGLCDEERRVKKHDKEQTPFNRFPCEHHLELRVAYKVPRAKKAVGATEPIVENRQQVRNRANGAGKF